MSSKENHEPKKQAFLQGAAILTVGAILAKIIGALFKIPLARLITTEGAGHFTVAYNIYTVLLNVSSTGLPVAASRYISEANSLGQRRLMQRIHKVSVLMFCVLGGLCSCAMLLFSSELAVWMRDPDAKYAIAVLAPAILFVCIGSAFRGYFQGQQYMTPTAAAQVIEALSKLLIGLAAVVVALKVGMGYPEAAGAAISGVTIGAVLSSIFFLSQYRSKKIRLSNREAGETIPAWTKIAWKIIKLAIPITIGAAGLQIFNTLGSKIILGRLQDALGYTSEEASSLYGIFSMAQTLYMLPYALIQPLTVSVIPAVTALLVQKNFSDAQKTEESAIRILGLVALPCGVGLSVLSSPIQRLLYSYDAGTLVIAKPVLGVLGIASVGYCLIMVTNSILQTNGLIRVSIYSTLAGGLSNIFVSYWLVGMEEFGILGASFGTLAYCIVALLVNVLTIRLKLKPAPRIIPQLTKSGAAAVIMGVVAVVVHRWLSSTVLAIGAAGVVFVALVYVLKIITWYDCQLLPKGELFARLLRVKKD